MRRKGSPMHLIKGTFLPALRSKFNGCGSTLRSQRKRRLRIRKAKWKKWPKFRRCRRSGMRESLVLYLTKSHTVKILNGNGLLCFNYYVPTIMFQLWYNYVSIADRCIDICEHQYYPLTTWILCSTMSSNNVDQRVEIIEVTSPLLRVVGRTTIERKRPSRGICRWWRQWNRYSSRSTPTYRPTYLPEATSTSPRRMPCYRFHRSVVPELRLKLVVPELCFLKLVVQYVGNSVGKDNLIFEDHFVDPGTRRQKNIPHEMKF